MGPNGVTRTARGRWTPMTSPASGRTLALVLSAGGLVGLLGGTMAFVIESKRAAVPTAGKEDSATLRAWVNPTSVGLSGTF